MSRTMIELRGVYRRYEADGEVVEALAAVDLAIDKGGFIALVGPSGSGKSTLLHLVGALDRPSAGEVFIDGQPLAGLDLRALAAVRNRTVGFVFQAFNLIAGLTVFNNVALPGVLAKQRPTQYRARVGELLELVGLTDKAERHPAQLSGGEQQRVAIARALLMDPPIVLADEPTGNLDTHAGTAVVDLLEACHDAGRTVVLATHDMRLASRTERVVHLKDGRLVSELSPRPEVTTGIASLLEVGP